ncbi:hypothetical protein Neosp_011867 [[Neocosmospora] mangrovei]
MDSLLQILNVTGFSAINNVSRDNTLLFRSPENGLPPVEYTNIGGTPDVNTLLRTPDVTGFSAVNNVSSTPNFRTPELPPGENTLLFRSPENGLPPVEYTNIGGTPGVNTLLRTPDCDQRPELPAGDNTLLFRSPENGLTSIENTNIGGTPSDAYPRGDAVETSKEVKSILYSAARRRIREWVKDALIEMTV